MNVVLETARVGIPRHIEPVAAVALTVVRRGKQLVDQMLPGVGRLIGHELGRFGGRGRQTEQVEVRAAHERVAIGARRSLEPAIRACFFQEPVDGIDEIFIGDDRRRRLHRQLERPIVALFRRDGPIHQRRHGCGV